jgi:hypothetical protein
MSIKVMRRCKRGLMMVDKSTAYVGELAETGSGKLVMHGRGWFVIFKSRSSPRVIYKVKTTMGSVDARHFTSYCMAHHVKSFIKKELQRSTGVPSLLCA